MQETSRIPKAAVIPLIEYCQKVALKNGGSGVDLFHHYLKLMKKHADYFFSEKWPKEQKSWNEFSDEDWKFIEKGKSYDDKCEQLTVVCLRRNISLKGFDAGCFDAEFEYNGKSSCWYCVVPEAVWLREHIAKVEQAKKENEEEMKKSKPSVTALEMHLYYGKPEVIRKGKMDEVKLRFLEEFGEPRGRVAVLKIDIRVVKGQSLKG